MYKIVREIPLGDHSITIKEDSQGHRIARLSSGSHGGLVEVQKLPDGRLRLRELEVGSAKISVELFALLLTEIGIGADLVSEINKINESKNTL